MKTPDYIITEYGCPKWNYVGKIDDDYNSKKYSMSKSLALCSNNNNNNIRNATINNINSNNSCKLAKLLTDKSRKLLPLRETLTDCYTRLLIVNNYNNNNNNNNNYNKTNYSRYNDYMHSATPSTMPVSLQEQKQQKNRKNEFIKQQQQRDNYINFSYGKMLSNNTTPTYANHIRHNRNPTLDVNQTTVSVESDLDVF